MWAGLNGFDPRTNLELGGERIALDCMNLVTVISRYTRVPVILAGTVQNLDSGLDHGLDSGLNNGPPT